MASFKNIILGIAIAIVFALAVGYGISVFYEEPKYEDYCKTFGRFATPYPAEKTLPGGVTVCNESLRFQVEQRAQQCYKDDYLPVYTYDNATGCPTDVRCDPCQKDFNDARKRYSRNIFIITAVVGIIGIAAGAILFGVEAVGAGLMGGGLLTILYGNIRYWEFFDNVMKFVILLAGLIILIGIGYWINRRRKTGTVQSV